MSIESTILSFWSGGDLTGTVRVSLVDARTRLPVVGASVTVGGVSGVTDTNGVVVLTVVAGTQSYSASANGYLTQTGLVSVVSGQQTNLDLEMQEAAQRLNYAAAENAVVRYYPVLQAVVMSFPTEDRQVNNQTLWWFVGKGFVEDSRGFRDVLPFGVTDEETRIVAWDADRGIMRDIDVEGVYTDDGNSVVCSFDTGYVHPGTGSPYAARETVSAWKWLSFETDQETPFVASESVEDLGELARVFYGNAREDVRLTLVGRYVRVAVQFVNNAFFRLSGIRLRSVGYRSFRARS